MMCSISLRAIANSLAGCTAKPRVGAGLLAMQATRCIRYTALMLSRASPLPQESCVSAQILAQQRVIQFCIAQYPHHFVIVVQHQFVAGLVANL